MPRRGDFTRLLLTGREIGGHIEVEIGVKRVALPCTAFQLLVDLAAATMNVDDGAIVAEAIAICRLRASLDKALGKGVGKRLIHTGMKRRYRLAFSASEARRRISLTSCFFHLADLAIISREQAEKMGTAFRVVKAK